MPFPFLPGNAKVCNSAMHVPLSFIWFFFQMFRKLHNSYTDVMCNPFYNPGDRIQSRAFDTMVTSMMVQVC